MPGRPTVLDNCRAHCACSRCGWGLFRLSSPIISLFPYRLKYCLKGPLKAKQQQQQHKFNFGYSLTELKLPVKDGKQCWPWPDCSSWILPSGPAPFATAFMSLLVLSGTWKKSLPTEIVCSEANKHFLKDGLVQWSKQTLFKGWPSDCFIFQASLFVKSTEPTNIFKLAVKETGQSAPTIANINTIIYNLCTLRTQN